MRLETSGGCHGAVGVGDLNPHGFQRHRLGLYLDRPRKNTDMMTGRLLWQELLVVALLKCLVTRTGLLPRQSGCKLMDGSAPLYLGPPTRNPSGPAPLGNAPRSLRTGTLAHRFISSFIEPTHTHTHTHRLASPAELKGGGERDPPRHTME